MICYDPRCPSDDKHVMYVCVHEIVYVLMYVRYGVLRFDVMRVFCYGMYLCVVCVHLCMYIVPG